MPRTPRTLQTSPIKVVQSEPDLTAIGEPTTSNVTARKRMRVGDTDEDSCQFEQLKSTLMSWKAEQDAILRKIVADVAELKVQNDSIKESNSEIVKSMHFLNKNYEEIKMRIESFEKEKKGLHASILGLEKKLQDFQNMSRSSTIEIRNVPTHEKETLKDLTAVVTGMCSALNVDVNPYDLRDVYRIPGKKGVNRSIVAEFSTVNKKSTILSSVKEYNKNKKIPDKLNTGAIGLPGKCLPVYVAEYLPPSTRKLFYLARNFAKDNKFDYCWTSNGNIFIRKEEGAKQILIQSEQCLLKLKPQE